jgi:hypothetical protein
MAGKLHRRQMLAVQKLMELHCIEGPGHVALYADGWDDERVHREVQAVNPLPEHAITLGQVEAHRRDVFGNLRKPPPEATQEARSKAMETLAARVSKLEAANEALAERTAKLEKRVSDAERMLFNLADAATKPDKARTANGELGI